ncbi:MAG: bacteriohemerythrin [Magnetococcales bacterium]|nr:bacteriohemerythrin [Magnetococcales bacterium]
MGKLVELWTKQLSIGIEDIDNQHLRLFEIMEEVITIIQKGGDDLLVMKTISSLMGYTLEHFTLEEYIMEKAEYPEVEAHSLLHKEFSDQLIKIKISFQEKSSPNEQLEKDIHKLLADWLRSHIREADGDYASFVQSKA